MRRFCTPRRLMVVAPLLLLLALAVGACAGAEPTATPTATPTPRPAATATPTPTLVPGAATPTPTIRVVLVATPTPTPTAPPVAVKPSGTLKYAMDAIPSTFTVDQIEGTAAARIYMGGLLYEFLIGTDLQGQLVPELATKWETTDGKTWDFTIRKGVTFSNGKEMTANDVKASMDIILKYGKTSAPKNLVRQVDRVEVPNADTVRIVTKEPNFLFYFDMAKASYRNYWVTSADYFNQVGEAKLRSEPMGTGPYVLTEKVSGDHVTFRVRDDVVKSGHWRVKPVYWEQVQAYKVQEESTRIAMLKTGRLDLIDIALALKTNWQAGPWSATRPSPLAPSACAASALPPPSSTTSRSARPSTWPPTWTPSPRPSSRTRLSARPSSTTPRTSGGLTQASSPIPTTQLRPSAWPRRRASHPQATR
ncbi:MAG: hypothetical protein HYY00_08065 [Chloroflexi bacterium]|nr:hypothetical protein [Chloroflexota bacterium]